MADLLPLFPLDTVLFPGVPLPLHIFEERYRLLVRELVDSPGPRRFGVVAVRRGVPGQPDGLYEVGCVAELRTVEPYADGRFDIVTTGGPRFRLRQTNSERPYLQGEVDYLSEDYGADADLHAPAVRTAFLAYWRAVAAARGMAAEPEQPQMPDDPALLSYLVAATMLLDLPDKQQLLDVPDVTARLERELALLRQETALATTLRAVPSRSFLAGEVSSN